MASWVWNTWNSLLNNHSVINAPSVICVRVMIKQLLGKHRRNFYSSVLHVPTEQPLHQKTRANLYTTATSIRSWFNFTLGIQVKIQIFHYLDRVKRIWYLSLMRATKVQASLRIRAVSPEPSLLAHTSSESRGTFWQKTRSLAPLNGWTCAVKICHDGMLEDTNSLDGAHVIWIQSCDIPCIIACFFVIVLF